MYEEPSQDAKNAAESLSHALNCMGGTANSDHVVSSMLNLHRTLNQCFTGNIVLPFVRKMAERYENGEYDPRNESACRVCHVMWEAVKKEYDFPGDRDFRLPLV